MNRDPELAVSLPLDSDGFLRRECPTCELEFKWSQTTADDEAGIDVPLGGYFCPNCRIQAPPEAWFTKPQLEYIEAVVAHDLVGPELEKLGREFRKIGRNSGGLIKTDFKMDKPAPAEPLTELDDMRIASFSCHPHEPLKVRTDWSQRVGCLICATDEEVQREGESGGSGSAST